MDLKNKKQESLLKPTPTLDPKVVESKIIKARKNLEESFLEFNKLFNDKVLNKNKTDASRNTEKQIVDKLYKAAAEVEINNIGEGVMSMGLISLRLALKARDRVNELEYTLYSTIKELKLLKEQLGKKDEPKGKS